MTRKDYERIAQALQNAKHEAASLATARDGVDAAIAYIADALKADNGAFKRERFLRACVPGANARARS